jgi:hypothetical protein
MKTFTMRSEHVMTIKGAPAHLPDSLLAPFFAGPEACDPVLNKVSLEVVTAAGGSVRGRLGR